ncbi:ATP/GTP-binding protein [Bdellovibrio sp. GT3]|uniref:ATP/GTP-binding protein n=1 Tax=Bdellovibrio sp. GT3 TaxID=3136282 RepID=UPI0030F1A8DD
MSHLENSSLKRIVLTGAPSSGKSSVMNELKSIYGNQVALIPESAVVLLSGGFPPPQHTELAEIRAFQNAIVEVQRGLEFILPHQNPEAKFMVFDRGTLDGAGFWPPGPEDYLKQFAIDKSAEYRKFTDVLFLELPTPEMFGGVNDKRFHNYQQSLHSEQQLEKAWSGHPGFQKISATPTLQEKIDLVAATIKKIISR